MTTAPSVAVVVCTFQRPEPLQLCLDALAAHESRHPFTVVVSDNSPDGNAREEVARRGERFHYIHEPAPGISHARNTATQWCIDEDTDLIAYVDDDQRVQTDWLDALVGLAERSGAQLVAGHAVSEFPADTPNWLRRSPAFNLRTYTTGTPVPEASTGNLLVHSEVFKNMPRDEWFLPELGLTGGSDTELTRRLVRSGIDILWCNESVVTEIVPAERAAAKWTVRRGARVAGQDSAWRLHSGETSPLAESLGGLARVLAGSGLLVASALNPGIRARGLWVLGRGLGILGATRGNLVVEYRRDQA